MTGQQTGAFFDSSGFATKQRWTAEEKMPALNNGLLSLRPRASSLPISDNL
jgi:hypothetical protein